MTRHILLLVCISFQNEKKLLMKNAGLIKAGAFYHLICEALITLHTSEIKEPLFAEPLLNLSSG